MKSFLDKIIDWKDFEKFVSKLYENSDDIIVKHNVTEVGKSEAKRQIDVLVIQKMKLHTVKIIIECKLWKQKVDRPVIDILAAAVEDLGADKGAIFTTKGYDEGAIKYAKEKKIDVFIIRDILEDEWGAPGRNILFYLQYFHSSLSKLTFDNISFFSPLGLRPTTTNINHGIYFSIDQKYPEHLDLYSLDGSAKGPNIVKLLIDIRNHLLNQSLQSFNVKMQPEEGNPEFILEGRVKLDFANYPFKFLKHETGYLTFDSISFTLCQSISQSKFELDRAGSNDFALIVENYITNQKNFASRLKGEEHIKLSEPIEPQEDGSDENVLKNGSIIKLMIEHYVANNLKQSPPITKVPDLTIILEPPQV